MKVTTSYGVDILGCNAIFRDTLKVYRNAVDFLINVCLEHWEEIEALGGNKQRKSFVEHLVHRTKDCTPVYKRFDRKFYKLPIYMLRSAISDALGLVSSYKSNLSNGVKAGKPRAGKAFPAMYRTGSYIQIDDYTAKLKVFRNNTWDWIVIDLKKQDVDYIKRRHSDRKICVPVLEKRGKKWQLRFAVEAKADLPKVTADTLIISVDLGLNNACTCTCMASDGTIYGRHLLKLPKETDSLSHAIGRIKKAQQHGNYKTPGL